MTQATRTKFIQKRCDQCQEIFLIPFIREGLAQRLVCYQAVCPLCNPNIKMCVDCFVPYTAKKHYAQGMCKTCYNFYKKKIYNAKDHAPDTLT